MQITMCCQREKGWGLYIAPNCPNDEYLSWADPDLEIINGFDNSYDAWVFAVAHFMVDPLHPKASRIFTLKPPKKEVKQMRLL